MGFSKHHDAAVVFGGSEGIGLAVAKALTAGHSDCVVVA